jgi:hypothetical protein
MRAGEISAEEYEVEESLEKNRISNISTVRSWLRFSSLHQVYPLKTHSNIGYTVTLCLNLTLLLPLKDTPWSTIMFWCCKSKYCYEDFPWLLTLFLCRVNSYWVLVGIWWCEPITNWHNIFH